MNTISCLNNFIYINFIGLILKIIMVTSFILKHKYVRLMLKIYLGVTIFVKLLILFSSLLYLFAGVPHEISVPKNILAFCVIVFSLFLYKESENAIIYVEEE
jgi:hypothetical protein